MQVKATFSTTGADKLVNKTAKQINAIKTSQLEKVGQQQVAAAQERIRSSKVSPTGQAWAPWSMATLKQRTRQGNVSNGLLYRTGALMTSIKYKIQNSTLVVYTDKVYGKFLQFGTPKMPARPFLGFGNQINNIIKTLKEALQ